MIIHCSELLSKVKSRHKWMQFRISLQKVDIFLEKK